MLMWVKGAGTAGGGLSGRKECRRFALTPHEGRTSRRFNAQVPGHFLQRRYTAFGRRMRGKELADMGRHNVKLRRGRVMFRDGIGDARRASRYLSYGRSQRTRIAADFTSGPIGSHPPGPADEIGRTPLWEKGW